MAENSAEDRKKLPLACPLQDRSGAAYVFILCLGLSHNRQGGNHQLNDSLPLIYLPDLHVFSADEILRIDHTDPIIRGSESVIGSAR